MKNFVLWLVIIIFAVYIGVSTACNFWLIKKIHKIEKQIDYIEKMSTGYMYFDEVIENENIEKEKIKNS